MSAAQETNVPSTVDVLASMGSLGLGEELKEKIMGALSELDHLQENSPNNSGSLKTAKQARRFLF